MKNIKKLVKIFEAEFGFDILKKTRKRKYVEARATLIYYLYTFEKISLLGISRLIHNHCGWKINHATIFHSIKLQPVYCKYNPKLDDVLKAVLGHFNNDRDKIQYIKNTVPRLSSDKVSNIHNNVLLEYEKQVIEDLQELEESKIN